MTSVTLTGPDTCAQCGNELDAEAILMEAMVTGTSDAITPAYVTVRGHKIAVPGLYWDRSCGARIESGDLESTLTLGAAQAFLDDTWGPSVTMVGIMATARGDDDLASEVARRLTDVLEVSFILETVIEALNEGSDLSWLPECHGHSHESAEVDPRDVAHLN